MNIGNITSNNFNLDGNGKDMQIEVYEQLIEQLQQENEQLKDNWKKLKEYLHNQIPTDKTVITKYIKIFEVLNKMQELEGSDSNE